MWLKDMKVYCCNYHSGILHTGNAGKLTNLPQSQMHHNRKDLSYSRRRGLGYGHDMVMRVSFQSMSTLMPTCALTNIKISHILQKPQHKIQ
jgi:hypothetical protein